MTNISKEVFVDQLQQIARCAPEIARKAVEIFYDDPMFVKLEDKMEVMLRHIYSFSRDPDFNKERLVSKLQQIARCGPETARRAVDVFADDPMYIDLDQKIEVMLDWVTAYNLSDAVNNEDISSPQRREQTDNERIKEEVEYDDLNLRWVTDEEEVERQEFEQELESQLNTTSLESLRQDGSDEAEETSPMKKQKTINDFGRGRLTGYGVPGSLTVHRQLHESIAGPPFFYFENVHRMPRGEWNSISRYLSAVQPEFTDSKHFTACSRPRGYIHNLPTDGRREISPKAPKTIIELIPECQEYWPEWDRRTSLNCILTDRASEYVQKKVEVLVELWTDKSKPPPIYVQNRLLKLARRFNLVWIKPGILVPLRVPDIEQVMGYDKDHTRALYHPNDRLKRLGDSFQVHTVGYHFSVLKPLHPGGMTVLSLFAGIGGAEVALQKLGIRLNVVVSVESDERSRRVLDSWWKATNQSGKLILRYTDVRALDRKTLGELLIEVGGFDLIVGGSPCKNLSGLNRISRTGLAGESSILFFEFPRILHQVREFMGLKEEKKKKKIYL